MELKELKAIFKKQIAENKKSKGTLLYFMVQRVTKVHENGAKDLTFGVSSILERELSKFPTNLVPSDRAGSEPLETPIFEEKAEDDDSSHEA